MRKVGGLSTVTNERVCSSAAQVAWGGRRLSRSAESGYRFLLFVSRVFGPGHEFLPLQDLRQAATLRARSACMQRRMPRSVQVDGRAAWSKLRLQ
jgi:hypothetical protein